MAESMHDGIRKVRLARESKRAGKDVFAWKVPYRTAEEKQTSETFTTPKAAKAFRDERRSAANHGLTFDLKAGRTTLREYTEGWLARQTSDPSSRETVEHRIRKHLLPALGGQQLAALAARPSLIQAWARGLQATL